MNRFDTFKTILMTGEKELDLHYTDYQDAYSYSLKYHSVISKHFVEHFTNHSDLNSGTYEHDLLRYIFIKAMEQRVSSDLYSSTARGNVCDIFHSPFDISLDEYPTNLPKFLEDAVNEFQGVALNLVKKLMNVISLGGFKALDEDVLNAVQFLGQTIGYHVGQENLRYKTYNTSDMLTRNELNQIAGANLCNWLEKNGIEVIEANFTRDTYQNIIAKQDKNTLYILMSAEVAPENPGYIQIDLDNLYNAAIEAHAVPCCISVSIGAVDEKHFQAGIVLYGDKCRFRVNAFDRFEK